MEKYPPLQFVFFDFEQPTVDAWEEFEKFVHIWNQTEQRAFESEQEGEWFITFEKGLEDPEIPPFRNKLQALNSKTGLVWFVGIKDERRPEDFEQSPFVEILGDTYPEGFIANEAVAFGPPEKCPQCGKGGNTFRNIVQPIIIDETFIGKSTSIAGKSIPLNLDIITLPNGGLLISNKVLQVFNKQKVKGYALAEVISKRTMSPSDNLFLMRAEKAIIQPCSEHTLVTESGICSTCGRILGGLLTHFNIRKEWLEDAAIFSRHPHCYAKIYLTNKLYWSLKNNDIQGMLPSYGIFQCDHS